MANSFVLHYGIEGEALRITATRRRGYTDSLVGAGLTLRIGLPYATEPIFTLTRAGGGIEIVSESASAISAIATIDPSSYTSAIDGDISVSIEAQLEIAYTGGNTQVEQFTGTLLRAY